MTLSLNQRLGHYEVVSLLGTGGMGEVYLARDTSELERTVAIKVLPAEIAADERRLHRFVQEAKTVSALNHPNILTVYEFGRDDSVRFIATEYVDGVTLREQMSDERLRLQEVLEIASQIAAALDAAHEAGVVHRDIKPENVMLRRRDSVVKVLDFGLAKLSDARAPAVASEARTKTLFKTEPGNVLGTVPYMSPEQTRGSEVDARTDIWSLGVVLYEMLTGRLPFEGGDVHRQIIAIQETEPPPLSRFADGVPERLEEIVSKALAKDAGERYQTAKDLLIDLKRLRQRLEFDAEIERTTPPELASAAGAAKHPAARETVSTAAYVTNGIKRHGRGVIVALSAFIVLSIAVTAYYFTQRASREAIDSVAVLPLINAGNDPNVEYLSDGMTESIISNLSQLPQLRVMARASVFRFKGQEVDPKEVGRQLGVQSVLVGRLLQQGERLIIRVELVKVSDGSQLWGAEYDRKLADALSVQQEISREISERLRLRLTNEEQKRLTGRDTGNAEAYQSYLKGRYYWNKRTEADLKKAIEYFNQAVDTDPSYALAYAGLADCYHVLPSYSSLPPEETYVKARAAVTKALEIDDQLSEAHAALAVVKSEYEWDFAGAEREFKRAIELNPNYPSAHQWYGEFLSSVGRHQEAIAEGKRALALDPLSLIINTILGGMYDDARQYDQALEQLRKTIEMDKNFGEAHLSLANVYQRKGMYREAIEERQTGLVLLGRDPEILARRATALKAAYEKAGARGYWQERLNQAQENWNQGRGLASEVARCYARLEEKDEAFTWLEKAYQRREQSFRILKNEPDYDGLRSDPRFQELLRRIGFPP